MLDKYAIILFIVMAVFCYMMYREARNYLNEPNRQKYSATLAREIERYKATEPRNLENH